MPRWQPDCSPHRVVSEALDINRYYRWQAPAGCASVSIAWSVMDEIRAHAIAGYKSVPGRGAEIGGALLGTVDKETGEILIDSFESLDIEQSSGASYALSETDYQHWEAWAKALHNAGAMRLVGFCRSHTRPGLRVAPEDNRLIERFFDGQTGTLLLVKPLSERECVAAFFPFAKGAVRDPGTPSREFPFAPANRPPAEAASDHPLRKQIGKWLTISAILAGMAAAFLLHWLSESHRENPIQESPKPAAALQSAPPDSAGEYIEPRPVEASKPTYAINSPLDNRKSKPFLRPKASGQTGEPADPPDLAIKSQNPGRLKRLVNGVAAKASHLWPFHSGRQGPPTQ